jgi:hypothetical protein
MRIDTPVKQNTAVGSLVLHMKVTISSGNKPESNQHDASISKVLNLMLGIP